MVVNEAHRITLSSMQNTVVVVVVVVAVIIVVVVVFVVVVVVSHIRESLVVVPCSIRQSIHYPTLTDAEPPFNIRQDGASQMPQFIRNQNYPQPYSAGSRRTYK